MLVRSVGCDISNIGMWMCSTLCDPYLNLFRGIIPPLNGTIDLSPILAFIALDVSFLLHCACLVLLLQACGTLLFVI